MENPFDAGYADNFPNIANIFETSPSIDTIARTKPADFSVHNSVNSSRTATHGQQHSPLEARSCGTGSGVPSRSARQPRPRVAKQLNFSEQLNYSVPASRETAVSSRSAAAAAGWPTHAVAASTALKGDRGVSTGSGRGGTARDVCMPSGSGSMPCNAAVQTEDAARAGASAPVLSALEASGNAPPPTAHCELPMPSRGIPRSPSAPLLRQQSLPPAPTDPSDAGSPRQPSAQVPPLSERIDNARRVLLQPPTFEFSQYLRTLLQRWPQRPLVRSRLSELGLSPSKARAARPIGPDGFPEMGTQHSAAMALQYPPWLSSPGPMPAPPLVHSVWPPYPYWSTPYPMPLPPAYWAPAQPAWHTPWHHVSPPPPAPQPAPPLTPHAYYPGAMPPGALWGASSWPTAAWPATSAFSTAALPGRRDLFKYVL